MPRRVKHEYDLNVVQRSFLLRNTVIFIADRYQSNTAKEVLDTVMGIQPKDSGGGGGETREMVVYRLADDMLGKLPDDYLEHEVRALKNHGALVYWPPPK